ncbi:hypothetical protein NP493_167g02020 [Ridgeia piscesae]|uniref:PLD phosphodiesterase domain-containing protein n=1 Tax=Ridgeia piscesae TaxID=27915 RepID=A0AAD9P3I2_RIDPI|nr:hypothetical protein NP493_167g02020 [Ridgeia piscesae]
MLLVDGKHFYVGSANFDWRALTQVKELGASVYNCSCLAEDMQKIFDVYWFMGKPNQSLPHQWPMKYSTSFNRFTPLKVQLNNTRSTVYLARDWSQDNSETDHKTTTRLITRQQRDWSQDNSETGHKTTVRLITRQQRD